MLVNIVFMRNPRPYILAHLKEPLQRTSEKLHTLLGKAEVTLRTRLVKQEKDLLRIEERCVDEDWLNRRTDINQLPFLVR